MKKQSIYASLLVIVLASLACSVPGVTTSGSPAQAAPEVQQPVSSDAPDQQDNGDCADLTEHPGPTTGQAKEALGVDVQRLDCEIAGFVWRGLPLSIKVRCAEGYLCTLHLTNDKIMVVLGDNQWYSIYAGTFRFIEAYPQEDAVHRPCEVVSKEQEFGRLEDPSFTVWTNLSCGG